MKIRILLLTAAAAIFTINLPASSYSYSIGEAREDIANLNYKQATEKLLGIALESQGTKKQEALLLLARLKSSPEEAEIIYQEVIDIDPGSNYAEKAYIEIAKIRYASARYDEAYDILNNVPCDKSREGCFLQGLSAFMMGDLDSAREKLSNVKRGRYRAWSDLILAELEMKQNNIESACNRYEILSRSGMIPVATYKFGECLEREGNIEAAREAFEDILNNYSETPEAVLANEKLKRLRLPDTEEPVQDVPKKELAPIQSGFTIQFGSFADRRNAIKLAEELKRSLPGVRIDTDLVRYREVHRVRYGYYKTREEALAKARETKELIGIESTVMKIP